MRKILLSLALSLVPLVAANIDGKWLAEVEQRGKRAADSRKAQVTLDLQSQGSKLTGTVSAGRRGRGMEIQNGKIEGDKFSFETLQKNRQGERKMVWSGTVTGDELKGERTREGGRRGVSFTAKRQK